MPQLNPEFFVSQLFWLAVFFSILFIFLWRVSLPRIAVVLEKRQNKIDEDISSAKELQEQAQEIEKNINKKISKAKQETDDEIKNVITSLQNNTISQLSSLDEDLEKKILKSEGEIIKKRNDEMKNINEQILNITKITLSKIAKLDLSDNDINEFLKSNTKSLN